MAQATRIFDVLRQRAAGAPMAEAVVDGGLRLTNAALSETVDAIAKGLLAAGIERGDRVATLAPPSADFWLLFLASTSVGAIWQGLNPRYQRNEYAYLLADAQPRLVFARTAFDGRAYLQELSALAPAGASFQPLDETPLGPDSEIARLGRSVTDAELAAARAAVDPEDAAVVVYTSRRCPASDSRPTASTRVTRAPRYRSLRRLRRETSPDNAAIRAAERSERLPSS